MTAITLRSIFQLSVIGVCVTIGCLFAFGILLKRRHPFLAPRCAARPKNTIFCDDNSNDDDDDTTNSNNKNKNNKKKKKHKKQLIQKFTYPGFGWIYNDDDDDDDDADNTNSNSNNNKNKNKNNINIKKKSKQLVKKYTNTYIGWIPYVLTLSYDTLLSGVPNTGTRNGGKSGALLDVNLDGIILIRFHEMGLRISLVASFLFLIILLPLYATSICYNVSDDELDDSDCTNQAGNMTDYELITIANVPRMGVLQPGNTFVFPSRDGTLGRYYAVVLCFGILTMYTLHELRNQWIENLALRRAYFTESNVWGDRQKELANIQINNAVAEHLNDEDTEDSARLNQRDVWIQHPEQRDCVPHIALYSVLVGKLPTPPNENNEQKLIDLHLALVSRFFDSCVPNQPGFSSSVAAVTIIPGASDMAQAWKRWYASVSQLRRLRFIRENIAKRREGNNNNKDSYSTTPDKNPFSHSIEKEMGLCSPLKSNMEGDDNDNVQDNLDIDLESEMNFGPEQLAVYSREYSQAGAGCCPYGPNERKLANASVEELLDLEDEVQESLQQANQELRLARQRIAASDGEAKSKALAMALSIMEVNVPKFRTSINMSSFPMSLNMPSFPMSLNMPLNMPSLPTSLNMNSLSNNIRSLPNSLNMSSLQTSLRTSLNRSLRLTDSDANANNAVTTETDAEANTKADAGADSATTDPIIADTTSDADATVDAMADGKADDIEHVTLESSLLQRHKSEGKATEVSRWDQVLAHMAENKRKMSDGVWKKPTLSKVIEESEQFRNEEMAALTSVHELYNESTYAIVTFTSRQAAVAARDCLVDSRGKHNWDTIPDLPIPPLADASACDDVCVFRNCCRPVTLTISDRAKNWRHYLAIALLCLIYFFYTVPLTAAAELLETDRIDEAFPLLDEWGLANTVASLLQGLIWTFFFSLNPMMFKAIANFGSNATSLANAELSALHYFWWFMVLSAFSGSWFTTMLVEGLKGGLHLSEEFQEVVRKIADSIVNISAQWLHWMIVKIFITFPLSYLIGINAFIFHYLHLSCLSRVQIGGGTGGPTPYRIYVDSGVVLMCVFALAPCSPIVAPFAALYFLFLQPLLRRNLVFVYRPKFDGGGFRWPFIFEICISALVVGEILLTVQMLLRGAIGPAVLSSATAIPTILIYLECRRTFKRPYRDAALLQTSFIDGWDPKDPWSSEKRESFRKWLVDAHKAAYVPVCLYGNDSDSFLTAEPAVVVDVAEENFRGNESFEDRENGKHTYQVAAASPKHQPGALFNRMTRSTKDVLKDENRPYQKFETVHEVLHEGDSEGQEVNLHDNKKDE